MNKTQKFALLCITLLLLANALMALVLIPVFFFGRCMPLLVARIVLAILLAVFIGGLFLATRRQNKKEVETDEMDITIQKMAAIISLVSVLIVVGVLLIIANLVWGLNAAVPLWVLMLLFGALVQVAVIVFAAAILIQYGWKEKRQ